MKSVWILKLKKVTNKMCDNKCLDCDCCPGNEKEQVCEDYEYIEDKIDHEKLLYLEDLIDEHEAKINYLKTKSLYVEKIAKIILASVFVFATIDIVTGVLILVNI